MEMDLSAQVEFHLGIFPNLINFVRVSTLLYLLC